jgi:hypothetical protein
LQDQLPRAPAPRLRHAITGLASLALVTLLSVACQKATPDVHQTVGSTARTIASGKVGDSPAGKYVCPMHAEVVSDKPGRCPTCGMDLVPAGSPK